jgi:hypothetical protein
MLPTYFVSFMRFGFMDLSINFDSIDKELQLYLEYDQDFTPDVGSLTSKDVYSASNRVRYGRFLVLRNHMKCLEDFSSDRFSVDEVIHYFLMHPTKPFNKMVWDACGRKNYRSLLC